VIGDFKGVGHFEAEFWVEGLLFTLISNYLWTVRYGNGCTTTLPLKVFTHRNFVADFIRLKLTFIPKKTKKITF